MLRTVNYVEPSATNVINKQGVHLGNGEIKISW